MMTIFLPHIYSLVKYEAGQGRKNVAIVERLCCPYHREVSRRGSVEFVLFCHGKVGRPSRPSGEKVAHTSGTLGLVYATRLGTGTCSGQACRGYSEAGRVDAHGPVQ